MILPPLTPALVAAFTSAFAASAVEAIEAFTIVLAVSVVRGWRPAVVGAATAAVVLVVVIAVAGPLLARAPIHGLQLALGLLLLVFGLGWLRKAVLRAGGRLALHDEAAAFASESASLTTTGAGKAGAADWLAGLVSFKAVLIEGTEVVFIVLALGARPGQLWPAAAGAAAAGACILSLGLLARKPLARAPENTLKFVVGGLLSGFGVFWSAEGMGAPWPGGDWAIPALVATFLAFAGILAAGLRRAAQAVG